MEERHGWLVPCQTRAQVAFFFKFIFIYSLYIWISVPVSCPGAPSHTPYSFSFFFERAEALPGYAPPWHIKSLQAKHILSH